MTLEQYYALIHLIEAIVEDFEYEDARSATNKRRVTEEVEKILVENKND